MAKPRTVFVCSSCGADAPRWSGQCSACGEWNTLAPFAEPRARAAGRSDTRRAERPETIARLVTEAEIRLPTGIAEFDRVLGGGLVPGSVTLIGGEPGIGKSTLLLQCAAALARENGVLYATGEESVRQVAERARRLAVDAGALKLVAETAVERILEFGNEAGARVIVIDSIQTMSVAGLDAAPGAVTQLRESTASLVRHAKSTGASVLLIGHVTREGVIAGPRVLEHMVDTVLYFESDSGSRFRVIRAVKNRFGAVNEIGVFAMEERGLREVRNPSAIFLSRSIDPVPGSVVTVAREGTRQMLIEVQALVDASQISNPRRVAVGFEANRVALLLAVLHRHAGVALHAHDVFVNVVGGVRLVETAADLAVIAALCSSLNGRPLPQDLVVFGEIGLTGEIRPVPYGEERLREAAKHGFRRAIVPRANVPRQLPEGLQIAPAAKVSEALAALG
ncbi:MAG TPA: DNA repair protein RadA [Steroidobacteraceae bacterium]